ncbi:unnamed protein product, partial [Owenia fusiformis]
MTLAELKISMQCIFVTGLIMIILEVFFTQSFVEKISKVHFSSFPEQAETDEKSLINSNFRASPNQADAEFSRHKIWDSLQCASIDKTQTQPKLKPQNANSNVPRELYHLNWTNSFLDDYKVIKWPKWDICEVRDEENLLLLFVISHKTAKPMRDEIRNTFGSVKRFSSWQIRTVFLYGDANNSVLPNEIDEDILVGNF